MHGPFHQSRVSTCVIWPCMAYTEWLSIIITSLKILLHLLALNPREGKEVQCEKKTFHYNKKEKAEKEREQSTALQHVQLC